MESVKSRMLSRRALFRGGVAAAAATAMTAGATQPVRADGHGGVVDLTHAGLFIDSRTFRSFEVFITLTFIYVGVALCFKAMLQFISWKTLGKRVA